jgi:hypothetical protein
MLDLQELMEAVSTRSTRPAQVLGSSAEAQSREWDA